MLVPIVSAARLAYGPALWLCQRLKTNKKTRRADFRIELPCLVEFAVAVDIIVSLLERLVAKSVVDRPPVKSQFKMAVACFAALAKFISSASATSRSSLPQRKLGETR